MTERLYRLTMRGLLVIVALALGVTLRPGTSFAAGLTITASTTTGATGSYIPFSVTGQASGTTLSFVVTGSGCIISNREVRTTTAGVCTVTAAEHFANGTNSYSSPVNFTFSHAPLATKVSRVVAGNRSVTVTWLPANTNGGAAISGYSVTSTPSVTPPSGCTHITALSCTYTGLNVGTSYTFKVTATNTSGSATSVSSVAATPYGIINNIHVYPRGLFKNKNFSGGDFSGFNLTKSNFVNCNFTNANLHNVNFSQANLAHATLTGADLSGTIFAGATILQSPTGGLTGTPASLPSGYSLTVGYLVGPHAFLSHADLRGANLAGVNLFKATMTATRSGGITGTPSALPPSWVLAKGFLFGPNAIVTGADVSGVNLSNSRLTGVVSGDLTGTPSALPLDFLLRGGYLVGPGANLSNVNFNGISLADAKLFKANLTGANVATASSLSGISSGSVVGTPTLPSSWRNINGVLVGAGANLAGNDLTGADLRSLDLSGADFTGAILQRANLQGATLANTTFDGADITDANFTNTDPTTASSTGLVGTTSLLPTNWLIIDASFAAPYTLSFDNNGGSGSLSSLTYPQGGDVTLPLDQGSLVAPQYQAFGGWNCNDTPYAGGDTFTISSDTTCAATWVAIPATLSFSAGTGTGSLDAVPGNVGDTVTLPDPTSTFTPPQYQAFSGWLCGSTTYQPTDTFRIPGNVTCVAQWFFPPATLSFDPGTGTGSIASKSYLQGDTVTLPDATGLTAPQYSAFSGWVCGFDSYAAGASFTIAGDTTCTAQWSAIPATVTYAAGDGTGSISPVTTTQGASLTLPDATGLTAPANQQFAGWVCGSLPYNAGETLFVTGDVTCTAQWSAIPATLTFDVNGASGSLDAITVNQGTSINLPDPSLSLTAPDGTTFLGWSVYVTGGDPATATTYNAGDSLTMDTSYTAVANWG